MLPHALVLEIPVVPIALALSAVVYSRERGTRMVAALKFHDATSHTITVADEQVLPVIGEVYAADLAKEVESLLASKGLRVDNIDEICWLSSDQESLA